MIERGNRDTWTVTPTDVARLQAPIAKDRAAAAATGNGRDRLAAALNPFGGAVPSTYFAELRKPENRDPRGYILSADQPDFPTATKFVNALRKTDVTVHRATAPFTVDGKRTRRARTSSRPRRRSARTCSTCSSRRTTRTTSRIRAARRSPRTTTPAGRSPTRWA